MSQKVASYVNQSLAGAGFCITDPVIAATLRPDLFGSGIEASWELSHAENLINGLSGVHRFTLRLADSRETTVVARSGNYLASRIEWILGREVLELFHESETAGTVLADDSPQRARASGTTSAGDRYAGVVTAEPARSCSSCDHLTAGHACRAAKLSGVEHPAANVPRRCLQFSPMWNALDQRKGVQLWPELVDHAD